MNIREVTRQYRLNQWAKIISECRSSGQTVKAWCAEHDINPKTYYYWLRKVREAACEALPALRENNSIVPVDIPIGAAGTSLVETSSPITLRLGSVTVELHNNASATLIENTLKVLKNAR